MKGWKAWLCALMVFAIGSVLIFGLIRAIAVKNIESSEAAGWMQAIGTVAAIVAAIWVSAEQHRRQVERDEDRERNEVDGVLRSLRTELETSLEFVEGGIGKDLEMSQKGTPFKVIYPVSEDSFKVYSGLIPKLGMIRSDDLRKQIIHTYGRCHGLILTFRYNNEMVEVFNAANRQVGPGFAQDSKTADWAERGLQRYADALRENYRETKVAVEKLLTMLPKG
jgi:hypothetical protein